MNAGAPDRAPADRLADLRRERAARLARLRGAAGSAAAAPDPAEPALEAFLRALRAAVDAAPPGAAAAVPAAVLPFQRPARPPVAEAEAPREIWEARSAAAPADLDRLPGVGPALVWALQRAGIAGLADLAGCAPAPLADRLGPLGGLVDLPGWIAFAREATGPAAAAPATA